ncbi:hypothetical protein [Daejeonella sp.]|jgi:hypothetical protein|uniref:hypothetical protein n=1 Tax=Daejeonella sp. TaxID=2805397 RepID=UPI0037C1498F
MDLTNYLKVIPLIRADDYLIVKKSSAYSFDIQPYFVGTNALEPESGFLVSSFHGRSIIKSHDDGYYRVLKGIGFTLFDKPVINICEYLDGHVWGALSRKCALKEFNFGKLAYSKGVYCPIYESVHSLSGSNFSGVGIKMIKPFILQYRVHSPIRISDSSFIDKKILKKHIKYLYKSNYSIQESFIDKCIENLAILHNNNLFYNALNIFNVCVSGEFLDFENSLSKSNPDFEVMQKYMPRELINLIFVLHAFASIIDEEFDIKYFKNRIKTNYLDKVDNPIIKKHHNRILELIKSC